jgi:hypothetical protein
MDYSDCLGYQLGFCRFRCTKEEAQRALKGDSKEVTDNV